MKRLWMAYIALASIAEGLVMLALLGSQPRGYRMKASIRFAQWNMHQEATRQKGTADE
jgi:hypothetical protein